MSQHKHLETRKKIIGELMKILTQIELSLHEHGKKHLYMTSDKQNFADVI